MCNARERLSYLLEVAPIGPHIRHVAPGVDAVNMEPGAALEEYGMMVLKVRALYRVVFENRFVAAFLRGTPGLEAWAMLGKAQFHAFETLADGSPRYDTVILDAPATGHGLDLLRVPKVILDAVPPGLLRRDAERAWALFSDPQRAGVVIVALPEELPANESIELYDTIRGELQLPVAALVVNQVLPRLFEANEASLLANVEANAAEGSPLRALAHASSARAAREAIQAECIARLAQAVPAARFELPTLFDADFRRAQVQALAQHLVEPTL